jgi:hypothetical protein
MGICRIVVFFRLSMSGSVHLSRMFVAKTAWRLTGCAVLDMQAAGRMRIIFPLPPFWPSSSSSTSSWVPYAWRSVVEVGWNHMPKPAFACCRLAGFHAYRIQVQHPLRYVACWCAGVQQDCFLEILSLSSQPPSSRSSYTPAAAPQRPHRLYKTACCSSRPRGQFGTRTRSGAWYSHAVPEGIEQCASRCHAGGGVG